MRKLFGVAAAGMLGVLALASSAGALPAVVDPDPSTAPASPGACVFAVDPASSLTFSVFVTVSGTAPAGVKVTVYLNGVAQTPKDVLVLADGKFSFANVSVPSSTTDISVNYTYGNKNAYTTICATSLNEIVIRVKAETAALAFTGSSSNTPTYVLVGFAAIVVGLVMVVGVRRRASVRG